MTRTAGAPIGCQRPSRFWGLGCPKIYHEAEDTLVLSYLLRDLNLNRWAGGAAQPLLTQTVLKQIEAPVPELRVQQKIAAILSAYDDLIENNLRRIKILEEIAQNIYREWFVKFRFPCHAKVRMVDSPLGETPEGWDIVKVGELLEKIKRKKKIKKQDYQLEGEIPVVDQGKDFVGGFTCDPDALHNDPLPIIVFGDHTRILKFIDFPFACGADGTQLLRSNTSRMPMSLFYSVLKSIDLSSFAYARHFKFLKEQEVLLPDEGSAEAYADFVEPLRDHIRSLMRKNNNLRQTRDLLLPKLISGELDVSTLPIDIGEAA
ncbi:restriction endonuclease subunit S [Thiolapillus sp.]|uniref:restriction endonuclease subunit S n=3 Tax=Thiolapillus sp. TaxID=2017437 RepID=UPI0025CBD390|nr:restriction endonuclease subunit S [Thiolapillus sp.]